MSTFFSISMPVHNTAKYLDEAIQSVIDQDYKNYELILVDDFSTDQSLQICERWKSLYPDKIKVIKNDVKGSLFARRECIHNSIGDYLYIMDSDDYLTDNSTLRIWDDIIQQKNCDLIVFNYINGSNSVFENTIFENGDVIEGKNLVLLYDAIAKGRGLNRIWDKVFSKNLIDDDDSIYITNSFLSHATDFFQSIAIVSKARRVSFLNKKLYYYRQTPGSITHTYNPNMLRSAEIIIERRNTISETWKYKPDSLEEKLKATALVELCTVINKIVKSGLSKNEKIEMLKKVNSSNSFLQNYEAKKRLPKEKRFVVELIHFRVYRILVYMVTVLN